MSYQRWTEEQDKILTENWGKKPTTQIGEMLGLSKNSVISRSRKLGLRSLKNHKYTAINGWSAKKEEALRAQWGQPVSQIAKSLSKTEGSIRSKAASMKLPPLRIASQPARLMPVILSPVRDMPRPASADDRKELYQLNPNQCRYPLWGEGEISGKYCGKIVCDKGQKQYCEECYSLCYVAGTARNIKPPRERNVIDSFQRKLEEKRQRERDFRFYGW